MKAAKPRDPFERLLEQAADALEHEAASYGDDLKNHVIPMKHAALSREIRAALARRHDRKETA